MRTKSDEKNSKIDCSQCKADCCKYVVLSYGFITKDILRQDENLRFALSHKNISLAIEGNKMGLVIEGECEYLVENKCSIYSDRFEICKDLSMSECLVNKKQSGIIIKNISELENYLNEEN